jgi:hypothetical protein
MDLNFAPGSSSRSPVMDEERPKGHGEHCGGIMASRPLSFTEGTLVETLSAHSFQFDSVPRSPPFPKLEFPKFDGSNPRLWQDHCNMFFEVYAVHPSLKTRFAALNFVGIAKTWLHTVERRERVADWLTLCKLVMGRFDKDQYPLILKQFEATDQTASVQEYIADFEQAAHNLLLYNPNYDETYFVTRFLAGLKEDIRAGIVLHRPPDVDTASALALLQEAELGRPRSKTQVKDSFRSSFKPNNEKLKIADVDKPKKQQMVTDSEDKLAALKNFRRRNGLCFKCGNKWSKEHKCPPQVALHVIEELLDALEDAGTEEVEPDSEALEETVMAVGHTSPSDQSRRRTMKLCGTIGKHEVLILVDSGSVASFISNKLADHLHLPSVPCQQTNFVAADGSPMSCTRQVKDMQWSVQGHSFISTVGILPLKCFDMIVGEDWLEECSPMWVHWSNKIMKFTYQGQRIELHGVSNVVAQCSAISAIGLQGLLSREAVHHCLQFKWEGDQPMLASQDQGINSITVTHADSLPDQVQSLLDSYQDLFQEPTSLPPQRPFDHHIQLLPGAPPVNIRPYKYSPAQKDEIEKQLTDML